MKLDLLILSFFSAASALTVAHNEAFSTGTPSLHKRFRDVIISPEYQKKLDEQAGKIVSTSTPPPRPWHRTIYSTVVEIVTPTVIGGVTFSAQPPAETNGMEPWISLNKDGSPKTIRPELKNGITKKGRPEYGTYFQTATTVTYNKEELKAHNMADDEVYEHVTHIPEDDTYVKLNPLMRCTPDSYYKKGLAKNVLSEPFCTPRENQDLKMDRTYFITWYTNYFPEDVKDVRIHLAYVKESPGEKGMRKRGTVQNTFFTSEWILNRDGYFALELKEEWLKDQYTQKILISIQPDNISEEDFDLMEHSTVIGISKRTKVVRKNEHEMDDGPNDEIYYIVLSLPTMVAIAALGMYCFVQYNKVDLSKLKKRTFQRDKTKHRRIPFKAGPRNQAYSQLPQYNADTELVASGSKND